MSATLDYRENFKKTLRTYERSGSKHGPPRPVFSAIYGGNNSRTGTADTKFADKTKSTRLAVNSKYSKQRQQVGKSIENAIPIKHKKLDVINNTDSKANAMQAREEYQDAEDFQRTLLRKSAAMNNS